MEGDIIFLSHGKLVTYQVPELISVINNSFKFKINEWNDMVHVHCTVHIQYFLFYDKFNFIVLISIQ